MHDLVQLQRNQMIDLRDARIDHHLGIAGDGHGSFEDLRDEFFDQVLAALFGGGLHAEAPFVDDLVEQALFCTCSVAAVAL